MLLAPVKANLCGVASRPAFAPKWSLQHLLYDYVSPLAPLHLIMMLIVINPYSNSQHFTLPHQSRWTPHGLQAKFTQNQKKVWMSQTPWAVHVDPYTVIQPGLHMESVTVAVWTPTLCTPDTLDRHIYFPLQVLDLATPLFCNSTPLFYICLHMSLFLFSTHLYSSI